MVRVTIYVWSFGVNEENDERTGQTISPASRADAGGVCAGSGRLGICTLARCKDETSISASPSSPPTLSVSDDADEEVGEDE
jgi:hypothetical protein